MSCERRRRRQSAQVVSRASRHAYYLVVGADGAGWITHAFSGPHPVDAAVVVLVTGASFAGSAVTFDG